MVVATLRPRATLEFIGCVISLVNLHQRLQIGIIVAPVSPLARRERVLHTDPPILPQVRIQKAAAVYLASVLVRANRQGTHTPVIEHYIAMAIRVSVAAKKYTSL